MTAPQKAARDAAEKWAVGTVKLDFGMFSNRRRATAAAGERGRE